MKSVTRVTQMTSNRTGEGIPNQLIIETENGKYFQSYQSIIAFKPFNGKIQLDSETWNFSNTTGKYRNEFLGETKERTQEKIKLGIYELVDLNDGRKPPVKRRR
jgi:hypothetical protein